MPRPATTITIAEPCAQAWQHMTPAASGRHCAACQEVVADFTQMTDAEILHFLRHNPAISCGRFTEEQLNRELRAARERPARWRTWLAAAATVLGLREVAALDSRAQKANLEVADIPRPGTTTPASWGSDSDVLTRQQEWQLAQDQRAEEMAAPGGRVGLRGTVCNRWGLPLAHAWVSVPDMPELKTTTNAAGHFYLEVPTSILTGPAQLSVRHKGHRSGWVELADSKARRYHFFLKARKRIYGGKFR